jgi:prepilin-type N-terminal cleavage/methylation domain-containing protein
MAKKGFSLIELLVIVTIIGLLASIILVPITSQMKRAKDANFKTMVSSIEPQLRICCDTEGGLIQDASGGDICVPSLKALYPDTIVLAEITIIQNCSDGNFEVIFKPGVKNTGNCQQALCTQSGCVYTGCP